jgi:hypothetical protein
MSIYLQVRRSISLDGLHLDYQAPTACVDQSLSSPTFEQKHS